MLIDGEWCGSVSGKVFPVHNPATGEVVDQAPLGVEDDLRAAVEAGIQAVMTAHILYPAIDADRPATLSRRILTDILRRDLGFDGVIISDGLEMGALSKNYSMRETLRWAIIAGVDLMLAYLRYPIGEMIDLVEDLVAEGELTVDDIDRGTERVLRLKLAHGLLDGAG